MFRLISQAAIRNVCVVAIAGREKEAHLSRSGVLISHDSHSAACKDAQRVHPIILASLVSMTFHGYLVQRTLLQQL